jgi:hypothetical protein
MTENRYPNGASVLSFLRFDPAVALLGIIGMLLGGLVLVVILARGGDTFIEPEGDLMKALTFDGAVGIYYVTLAFYVPLAAFSAAGRRRWVAAAWLITIYGFSVETMQVLRGIDPRFTEEGGAIDSVAGVLFGVSALGHIVLYLILASSIFRRPDSPLMLAIRYASVAVMSAFAAGIVMSVVSGRGVGEAGNLLPLHAIGFHGLQAIPVVAWLLERSQMDLGTARRLVHVTGVAWVIATAATGLQAATGAAPFDVSPALFATVAALAIWLVGIAAAASAWIKDGRSLAVEGSRAA